MRKKIVAGNWKMNQDLESGKALFAEIVNGAKQEITGEQLVVVCPPSIILSELANSAKDSSNVFVGSQNCHQKDSGAYTGEISAAMVKSTAAEYVILGHSERRQYFGENEELLAQKVDAALKNGLKPIFCIGETLEERNSNRYFEVIKSQLEGGLFHLTAEQFADIVLAYEPVWAIGTGLTASPEQAQEIHAFIRAELAKKFGQEAADNATILYGGSCNPGNASSLFSQQDIDGGLIGGASLKAGDFLAIIKALN
ncbi:MAG: triose-phosphate isomerase [Sphingobacteriaceae bacterium]|jgi:triosephosphate isomerase|nr:triose-phosphate isomerase [Sphingobacteriaceae bacterium]